MKHRIDHDRLRARDRCALRRGLRAGCGHPRLRRLRGDGQRRPDGSGSRDRVDEQRDGVEPGRLVATRSTSRLTDGVRLGTRRARQPTSGRRSRRCEDRVPGPAGGIAAGLLSRRRRCNRLRIEPLRNGHALMHRHALRCSARPPRPHSRACRAAAFVLGAHLPARAQDDPLPSWNDGRGEAGDPRLRRRDHHRGRRELRRAGGPHRHLRPGRHHLGRAAALRPGPLRPRPAGRDGARAPRVEGHRAVQVGADRRPRRDGEVHREGLDGDRRRHPRRHEHRRLRGAGRRLAAEVRQPGLQAAGHRARLPADARGDGLPARQRLPHLHRHRRRPGVRPRLLRGRSTASRSSRWSARASSPSTRRSTASPC